ncbi:aromatic acid exporter family protein [Saccharopolyspora gloriosae]|uniref:FUSC family protein n=1 Tax=Saccharopolyspora gloriosae TaxID=455344 RepID=UPI001FB6F4B2|nr:aromatic acid exporter family protein [Saccharopolyspora gloriosae]
MQVRWERVAGVVRRAFGHAGPDRDALLLIVKSVAAATMAWVLANNVLGAPSATFAPFTALLMVQATISQSLDQSARYALAMVFGVVLAGLITPVLGAATLTFAVLILIALVLGRWRKLGQQGPQVGVAALFAYSSFTQTGGPSSASFVSLASIAGLVVLGCGLGILTNLVLVPPIRYRNAEYGITALSHSLCELLTDIADGIADGAPTRDQAAEWRHRADQFPAAAAQARATVEQVAETMRFNPRRWLRRSSSSFTGHRVVINALERAGEQLRSAGRGLTSAVDTYHSLQDEHDRFLAAYSSILREVGEAARILGQLRTTATERSTDELRDTTDRAGRAYDSLIEQSTNQRLDSPEQWPVYGALQTDAQRLIEEFLQAQQNLDQLMPEPEDATSNSAGPQRTNS